MKSVRMADDDYLKIIKSHIDSFAAFEDNRIFNLIAPIGEFVLKAIIRDCYSFGAQYEDLFTTMIEVEKAIRSENKIYLNNPSPAYCLFTFDQLIHMWIKGQVRNLWHKIYRTTYEINLPFVDFYQFKSLRNDASHSNKFIENISSLKQYYTLLELFDLVMPCHIAKSYPLIFSAYTEYFKNKIIDKEDKLSQLDEVLNRLEQFRQRHDHEPEHKLATNNSDKVSEILYKIDLLDFNENLKQIMAEHVSERQHNKIKNKIKPDFMINENNFITFIDDLDIGKELKIYEVNNFVQDINCDLLPFSSSNNEPTGEPVLIDFQRDYIDNESFESIGNPRNAEVISETDEGIISGALKWINKITKTGSLVADKFSAEVKRRAEEGNAHFQNVHGVLHFHGRIFSKDIEEAFNWFVKAASQGYAPAQLNLGKMYLKGLHVKVNHARAVELITTAANQGLIEAIEVLAIIYYFGEGIEKNQSLAEKWFEKAAEGCSAKAQESLGIIHYKKGNYFKSVEYLDLAAKSDMVSAQNLLGIIYGTCDGVIDYGKAENMFKMAIKNNYSSSRINLGILYFKYRQFDKNLEDIKKILKPLLTNDTGAQYCLGVMYYKSKYFEEAAKWLELAAKKEAKALYNLGTMYYEGQGYSKSIDDALRMYNRAADNHPLTYAYLSLGFIHYNGIKTQRLYEESLEYFKLAAEQGSSLADKVLAKMYYYGIGTDVDYEQFHQRCRSAYIKGEHDVLEFVHPS